MEYEILHGDEVRVNLSLFSSYERSDHQLPIIDWSTINVFRNVENEDCFCCSYFRTKLFNCPLFNFINENEDIKSVKIYFLDGIIDTCFCLSFFRFFEEFSLKWGKKHAKKIIHLAFTNCNIKSPWLFYSLILFRIVFKPCVFGYDYLLDFFSPITTNYNELFTIPTLFRKKCGQCGTIRIVENSTFDVFETFKFLMKLHFNNLVVIHRNNPRGYFDVGFEIFIQINDHQYVRLTMDPLFTQSFMILVCNKILDFLIVSNKEYHLTYDNHLKWTIKLETSSTNSIPLTKKRSKITEGVTTTTTTTTQSNKSIDQYTGINKKIAELMEVVKQLDEESGGKWLQKN